MAAQAFFNTIYADLRSLGAGHVQAAVGAAQSGIETGWGKRLKGDAYFGIKANSSWEGQAINFRTSEVLGGQKVNINADFRDYDDRLDAVRDYANVIEAAFPDVWRANNIEAAAAGLARGVHGAYATDPDYVELVVEIANDRALDAEVAYENGNGSGLVVAAKGRPQQEGDVTHAVLSAHLDMLPNDYGGEAVILAVRGYYRDSKGKVGENDRGIFDDAAFIISPRGVWAFNFNVDPSRHRSGIAAYKAPQAVSFKQGIHGYSKPAHLRYRALEQVSQADVTRDGRADDFGDFHMNIHKGSASGGTSSAGCCTVPVEQWDEFFETVCREMDADGQSRIWMVLLEYQGGNPPIDLPAPAKEPAVAAPPMPAPIPDQLPDRVPPTGGGAVQVPVTLGPTFDTERLAEMVRAVTEAGADVSVNVTINVAVPPNFTPADQPATNQETSA
ncbi:MAG: glucosaminidase domain-containing protein [Pseudomonadota bacterium]